MGTSGVDMFVYIHVGWNVVCARKDETVVQTYITDTGRAGASAARTYENKRMVKQCNGVQAAERTRHGQESDKCQPRNREKKIYRFAKSQTKSLQATTYPIRKKTPKIRRGVSTACAKDTSSEMK